MITTGTIEILDSNNEGVESWELKNIQVINGKPFLKDQVTPGYYANVKDGIIYVEELKPQTSAGGLTMWISTLMSASDNWVHLEDIDV